MTGRPSDDAPPSSDELPVAAYWCALASLGGVGPAGLRAVADRSDPVDAWERVVAGQAASVPGLCGDHLRADARTMRAAALRVEADELDVAELWRRHRSVSVVVRGDPAMPERLADDIDPPQVLFAQGDLSVVEGPTVAIVGTRRCTPGGAELAHDIGRTCSAAGARVISGLAVGIDTAAHAGALDAGEGAAPPVAVVGSGLDVVYPARSRALWRAVAEAGVVLSEYPLGTSPARWRFPARNRLVAALADVVVVIESPQRGGSMYTVDEALRRQRDVLAVPGSIHSLASKGTNWLLSQGAQPCCGSDDVLTALGLSPDRPVTRVARADTRPRPTGDGRRVLRAMGWDPTGLDGLAERTGLGLGALAIAVDRLEAAGWIERVDGRLQRKPAP